MGSDPRCRWPLRLSCGGIPPAAAHRLELRRRQRLPRADIDLLLVGDAFGQEAGDLRLHLCRLRALRRRAEVIAPSSRRRPRRRGRQARPCWRAQRVPAGARLAPRAGRRTRPRADVATTLRPEQLFAGGCEEGGNERDPSEQHHEHRDRDRGSEHLELAEVRKPGPSRWRPRCQRWLIRLPRAPHRSVGPCR